MTSPYEWLALRPSRDAWILLFALLLSFPEPRAAAKNVLLDDLGAGPKTHGSDVHQVDERHDVPILELVGEYDAEIGGVTNAAPREAVAREFFRHHADEYDALLVFTTFEFDTGSALALHLSVQNDVEGIQRPLFDRSARFGSDGRLHSYVDMASVERWDLDPLSRDYEHVLVTATHELLHRWCCDLEVPGAERDALLGGGGHWSYLLDSDASVMYGHEWRDNGDGTHTAVEIRRRYSDLDLYTAGFLSPDEVRAVRLLENPDADPAALPELGVTIPASVRELTIDEIVDANGPRVEPAEQTSFRAAVVLLKRPDEVVDDELLAQLDVFRRELATRFSIATRGRAVLEVHPSARPLEPGAPGGVDGGTVRSGAASITDGLSWLRARQEAEGSWLDAPGTAVRDTTEALRTLAVLDPAFSGRAAALDWLRRRETANADEVARIVSVLAALGENPGDGPDRLTASRNDDGGWGLAADLGSSSLDTALALRALAATRSAGSADPAGAFLLAERGADGGWSPGTGGASRVSATTEAVLALHAAGRTDDALSLLGDWLRSRQNPDGGFGDSPSTPQATAEVLLALSELGATSLVNADAAVDYLRSRQTESGSWAGSVHSTALAVRALRRSLFPNWSFAGEVELDPAAPRDGERVELHFAIENDGNLATPAGLLRLHEGDPDAGAPVAGEYALPELDPGAVVEVVASWDTYDRSGPQTLVAVLDPDDATDELSELDNRTELSFEVAPAPSEADLEIDAAEILVTPERPTELPADLLFSAVVRNFGLADAAGVRVVLRREDGTIADEATISVPARSSNGVDLAFRLEAPGEHDFTVEADADDAVAEADETNNAASVTVSTVSGLDLEVLDADLALDGAAIAGTDVSLDATVRNRGTVDSSTVTIRAVVEAGSGAVSEVASVEAVLAAGTEESFSWPWRVAATGDWTYRVEIDPGGLVPETDESNNVAELLFTAADGAGTNLSLSHHDLAFVPEPAAEGGTVELRATVRNTGGDDLSDVVVAFYEGDPADGGAEVGRATAADLPAGASEMLSTSWGPLDGAGERLVFAVADPDGAVAETDESDNSAFDTLQVTALPDLVVSESAVRLDPPFPRAGEALTIEVDVANLGEQAAQDVRVQVDAFESDGTMLVGTADVTELLPGAFETVSFPWTAPAEPSTLVVTVDPEDLLAEGLEANNAAEVAVLPQPEGELVSPRFVSPNGDGVQDAAAFFYGDAGLGTVEIEIFADDEGSNGAGRPVRTAAEDTGTFTWDGRSTAGSVVEDGSYRLVASSGGSVVAEGRVVVDTNRSHLFDAEGTRFERIVNLTCETTDVYDLYLSDHGYDAVYRRQESGSDSVYRQVAGGPRQEIFQIADGLDVTRDGQLILSYGEIRRPDGRTHMTLGDTDQEFFGPEGDAVYWVQDLVLWKRPNGDAGADPVRVADLPERIRYWTFSPDGSTLFGITHNGRDPDSGWFFALDSGEVHEIPLIEFGVTWANWTWTPDSEHLILLRYDESLTSPIADGMLVVEVYDRRGVRVRRFVLDPPRIGATPVASDLPPEVNLPTDSFLWNFDVYDFSVPIVSTSGDSVYFSAYFWEDSATHYAEHGALYRFDLASGALEVVSWLGPHVWEFENFEWYEIPASETRLPLEHTLLPSLSDDGSLLVNEGSTLWKVSPAGPPHGQVLGSVVSPWASYFRAAGSRLLLWSEGDMDDPDHRCHQPRRDSNDASALVFESTANLTLQLQPRPADGGAGWILHGTAADLHLAEWWLEWSDESVPGFWHPIGVRGTQPVFDEDLAAWSPPGAGSYLVRLTGRDLAGNRRSTVTRLSAAGSSTPDVSEAFLAPRVVSPNGDGILDSTTLHYRVEAPVHLQIRVVDAADRVVRTFERDHASPGVFEIPWGGRDGAGRPLPDGDYVFEILHHRLRATIDTEVPAVEVAPVRPVGSEAVGPPFAQETYVTFGTAIDWSVADTHFDSGELEYRYLSSPEGWQVLRSTATATEGAVTVSVPVDLFVEGGFRATARDAAGNEARVEALPGAEMLAVHGFGVEGSALGRVPVTSPIPVDAAAPGFRLLVGETMRDDVVSLWVEARDATDSAWRRDPVEAVYDRAGTPAAGIPDHHFQALWTGELSSGLMELRLCAADAAGTQRCSNVVRLGPQGGLALSLRQLEAGDFDTTQNPHADALLAAVETASLEPAELLADASHWLWVHAPTEVMGASLLVESEDDPRYAAGKSLLHVARSGDVFLYDAGELRGCRRYSAQAGARDLATGEALQSNRVAWGEPCVEIDAELERDAAACDALADPLATLHLTPKSLSGNALLTLEAALDDPAEVFWNLNEPVSGESHSVEIDTTDLAEGRHEIFLRLADVTGDETRGRIVFVVERQAPEVEWLFPVDGASVCAAAAGPVEFAASDVGLGFGWSVSIRPPGGAWDVFESDEAGGPADGSVRSFSRLVTTERSLGELDGALEARVRVDDLAGNATCRDVAFAIDGEHATALHVSDPLLSPNGDGNADVTLLQVSVSEPAVADAAVYAAELRDVGGVHRWVPVGSPLRTLAVDLALSTTADLAWDGRLAGGSVAADGMYLAVLDSRDGCGNSARVSHPLEVDLTPPGVSIDAPLEGQAIDTLVTEIVGTASDRNLERWRLGVGQGTDPTTFVHLADSSTETRNELLATWNTGDLQGIHTLRLIADDRAGLSSIVSRRVDLGGGDGLLGAFEVSPGLFSPRAEGTGAVDRASVRSVLLEDAVVTLEIVDSAGAVIRTLVDGETRSAGNALDGWDGRDADLRIAPDGAYRARIRAEAAAGPVQTEEATVRVDATDPAIVIDQPTSGFTAPGGLVVGSVLDPNLESYRLELALEPESPDWTLLAEGSTERSSEPLATLDGLSEGEALLRVSASDAAGNESKVVLALTVDGDAPAVELLSPADGAFVSSAGGPVAVAAEVSEAHPSGWRLETRAGELGSGDPEVGWVEVVRGSGAPASPPAAVAGWQVAGLADGPHGLRLRVFDRAGLEGVDTVQVVVDDTPPTVAITTPAEGSFVVEPGEILGTATDAHFSHYLLELAPGTPSSPGAFSRLGHLAEPVEGGVLLDWRALPPDGPYVLRLLAFDESGNRAEVLRALEIDTHPPSPPGDLRAEADADASAVTLSWTASPETDVVGYHVERDGVRLTSVPVAATSYVEDPAPEGLLGYRVVAVDRAGHESEPAGPAEVLVDRSPPHTRITAPADGASVGGVLTISGTAYSEDDFAELRVLAGAEGGALPQIHRSTLAVRSDEIVTWNASGLGHGTTASIRLESEDVRGNAAAHEIRVTVDLEAPSKPTGLTATPSGSDVALAWDAAPESDVVGHLLYRNGSLLVGPADDLRNVAVGDTAWDDLAVPDGEHVYVIVAIDAAGNLSPPSDPATVDLDERAPHATWVEPDEGAKTDGDLYLLAATADRDVAEVAFEVRAEGEAAWTPVSADSAEPWEARWDPAGAPYGHYVFRAVATDDGGRADPAPAEVTVSYQDLEPPAPPTGLVARVDGDVVELSWNANGEGDLRGYHVERLDTEGVATRLTAAPVAATTYADTGVADGVYAYRLVAVDTFDNESNASDAVDAVVWIPTLEAVVSPTHEDATSLVGWAVSPLGPVSGEVDVEVIDPGGASQNLAPVAPDAEGRFEATDIPLSFGTNRLRATVTDGDGNRSRAGERLVLRSQVPSAPTGLAGTETDGRIDLGWNSNPEPDILGYLVYEDGYRMNGWGEIATSAMTASASTEEEGYEASEALSGGYWAPVVNESTPVAGQWWQATFDEAAVVERVYVEWDYYGYQAVDFDLQLLGGGGWRTVVEVRGNEDYRGWLELPEPTWGEGFRLLIHTMAGSPAEEHPLQLDAIEVETLEPPPETSWSDAWYGDGIYEFSVTAVSEAGFESEPATVEVRVGDTTPPEPVVLSHVVTGSDVRLSWQPSPSPDVYYHQVYRDGVRIGSANAADTTFTDAGVPNGTHEYWLVTLDREWNGAKSNVVQATVDVPPPPSPRALAVAIPPEGSALDLAWDPPGPPVAGYRLYRATSGGGPWELVAETVETTHLDSGLENGTEYFYVVRSLDDLGNESPDSNEVSAIPEDTLAPVTRLVSPTVPGRPHSVPTRILGRLAGLSEPAAAVEIERNGEPAAEVVAAAESRIDWAPAELDDAGAPYLSPDGRRLLATERSYWRAPQLYDFDDGSRKTLDMEGWPLHWMPDGESVVYSDSEWPVASIFRQDVTDGSEEKIAEVDWVDMLLPSPDGSRLMVLGEVGGTDGFHLLDLDTGAWTLVASLSTWRIEPASVVYFPDGEHLAYVERGEVKLLEIATGTVTLVEAEGSNGPSLHPSPSGDRLAYVARPDGDWQIFVYHLMDGSVRQVTSGNVEHRNARFVADGDRLAVVSENGRLDLLDPATGERTELHRYSYWDEELSAAGGFLALVDDGALARVTPAGLFEAFHLPLDVGDNFFTARGTDSSGNIGAPSEPVLVQVLPSDLPDLRVTADDVRVLPAFPIAGEGSRLTVTVRNVGGVDSGPSELRWALIEEKNGARRKSVADGRVEVPALAPGGVTDLAVDLSFPLAGRFVLAANADPLDELVEVDEGNNRAEREVIVLESAGPGLFVRTAREVYGGGEDVAIDLDLVNGGPSFAGRIDLRIEDAAGFPVEEIPGFDAVALQFGERWAGTTAWNAGDIFAGDYRVVATLVSTATGDAGAVLAEAQGPFRVSDDAVLTATSRPESAVVPLGSDVVLRTFLRYESGNRLLSGLQARLRIEDESGQTVDERVAGAGSLLPGDEATVPTTWPSAGAEIGTYAAVVEMYEDADLLATTETTFELTRPVGGLVGEVDLSPAAPPVGVDLAVSYAVESTATGDRSSLPVRLRLVDPVGEIVLAQEAVAIDLPAGGRFEGTASFATATLRLGSHLLHLEAEADGAWQRLASASFDTVDGTPPTVAWSHPQDGGWLGVGDRFVVSSGDLHSSVDAVSVLLDGGVAEAPAILSDPAAGLWSASAEGISEGEHRAVARAVDAWDNEARTGEIVFRADLTPPVIEISGVEEGASYTSAVYPVVTITELHPSSEEITLNGLPFVSGTAVENEGAYRLSATATDQAGNRSHRDVRFLIGAPPLPALTASKSVTLADDHDASGDVTPGDDLAYAITVGNGGEASATDVLLRDDLPLAIEIVAGTLTLDRGEVRGTDPLEIAVGELAPGESVRVRFRARIAEYPEEDDGLLTNQGTVESIEQAPVLTDDPSLPGSADPTTLRVLPAPIATSPILSLSKIDYLRVDHDGSGHARPGDEIEYEIVLRNDGDGAATGLRLEDLTPPGSTYVFGSLVVDAEAAVRAEDPLAVEWDRLDPGERRTVLFRVRLEDFDGEESEISNQAWLYSVESDDLPSDDPARPDAADPTVTEVSAPLPADPVEIPTLGVFARLLLGLVLAGLGLRRSRSPQTGSRSRENER